MDWLNNSTSVDLVISEMVSILAGRENIDESIIVQVLTEKYPNFTPLELYLIEKSVLLKVDNRKKTKEVFELRNKMNGLIQQILLLESIKEAINIDDLTGLPNYNGFINTLSIDQDRTLILFHINDMFRINDAYSQQVGDHVIKKIGKMLENFCAEFLEGEVQAYRFVGTTFAIVFDGHVSHESIEHQYDRVRSIQVRHPVNKDILIPLSFSVGVANGADIHSAVHYAEQALKTSRRLKQVVFYDNNTQFSYNSKELFAMRTHINEVLEKDLFDVYVQEIIPTKICINNNHKRKFECLLRVYQNDKKDSFVNLGKFLDVVKKDGRNVELTTKVIERVCNMMKGNDFHFSINLTEDDLIMNGGSEKIYHQILQYRDFGITPDRITLEILEDIGEGNIEIIQENVRKLKGYGFSIALDDFGAGRSNFSRLTMSITSIKLDMAYIRGIDANTPQANTHKNIVRAIVYYAHSEGITVVAEGVETEGVKNCLVELGADYLQGYFYGKPDSLGAILSK